MEGTKVDVRLRDESGGACTNAQISSTCASRLALPTPGLAVLVPGTAVPIPGLAVLVPGAALPLPRLTVLVPGAALPSLWPHTAKLGICTANLDVGRANVVITTASPGDGRASQ